MPSGKSGEYSFCVGASVGSRRAPAAQVGKLTDKKVYNGSTGGYGIAQYLGIIKMLTQGLPAEQRYTGKDVVVMFYVGNDFNVDIIHDQRRRSYTRGALFWLLELGPLRAWMEYISDSLAHAAPPVQIPTGLYAPIPMKCETAGGLPFAWHPGFSTFLKPKNIAEPRPEAWELIGELAALQAAGLNIKVVVVPANIQVIFDDIDWQAIPPTSPIAVNSPKIYSILNDVKADALSMFKSYGFDTLDMTPIDLPWAWLFPAAKTTTAIFPSIPPSARTKRKSATSLKTWPPPCSQPPWASISTLKPLTTNAAKST